MPPRMPPTMGPVLEEDLGVGEEEGEGEVDMYARAGVEEGGKVESEDDVRDGVGEVDVVREEDEEEDRFGLVWVVSPLTMKTPFLSWQHWFATVPFPQQKLPSEQCVTVDSMVAN